MVSQSRRAKKNIVWTIGNTAADGSGIDLHTLVDANGHLQVDVVSGGTAGEQYPNAEAFGAAKKGNLILGTDGSNYQIISTQTDGYINMRTFRLADGTPARMLVDADMHGQVDILSITAGTNVIGKVRPVSANGDELSNDTEDFNNVSGGKLWNHKETFAVSSGTTATYTIPKNILLKKIHMRIPTMTNAGNAKITFETQTDGYVLYDSGNKAENANYTLSFEDLLATNDIIKITIDVSDTANIILDMYGLILQ